MYQNHRSILPLKQVPNLSETSKIYKLYLFTWQKTGLIPCMLDAYQNSATYNRSQQTHRHRKRLAFKTAELALFTRVLDNLNPSLQGGLAKQRSTDGRLRIAICFYHCHH